MKILVVDDSEVIRSALVDLLTDNGHSVIAVADGREALAACGSRPFDLILLDMLMPGVDGWQFLRERAKLPEPVSTVPVIILSARSDDEIECVRGLGVEGTLRKPVDLDELLDAVNRLAPGEQHAPVPSASRHVQRP